MDKVEIRKHINEKRKSLKREEILCYSNIIIEELKKQAYFKKTRAMYSYVSYREEVLTKPLIEYAFRHNMDVAVPKVKDGKMDFYYIDNLEDDLKEGYNGILEPVKNCIASNKSAVVIMPGLAFDLKGNRIGYGGGYYDEYLDRHKDLNYYKVAVAYDFQVVDEIPSEQFDQKVDLIITEKRVISTQEG